MKAFSKITTFIMLIISVSCQQNNYLTGNSQPEIVTVKTTTVTASDNAFGLNLFQNLSRTNIDENRLISPLSVSAVLAMAYNGAEKDTRTQMEKAMMLNGLSKEQINDGYKTLLSELELADEQVVFDIANALYYSGNFSVKPEFLEVNKKVYDAEISGLDFSSPEAVQTVNNWVAEKTNGKINNIVSQLQPLDRMILLNAIYFYGTWSSEFDKYGTQNLQFIKNDNNHIEVPMMNLMDKVPYLKSDAFTAIKKPYGNEQFNMVVILPEKDQTIKSITGMLSVERWNNWMNEFKPTERVNITMPRFKFEFEISLKEILKSMGMEKPFVPEQADFSDISDEELFISEIKHKTFIDVNETGTEAAAVTSAVFSTTSMMEEPPIIPFYVNKPFIFAITEEKTNTILFIGEVNLPEYK